jgi:hypothetical protein
MVIGCLEGVFSILSLIFEHQLDVLVVSHDGTPQAHLSFASIIGNA